MATVHQNQEGTPDSLRKQLAFAVKSIQWSYAIMWSISSRQPGVLEWGDGYYNGDIKTRKTVQAVEFNVDELGLQRSEQLRELYESLSAGESSPQARRPSAALSPEDLTDTEWYFLVCMSFVFNIGQGLPGRTLANNRTIWLCNAHYADSKVFSRSLLAKSASIQTVVCFPYSGGVVELGVTERVLEDPNLIQHIKTSFLEIPYPNVSKIPKYVSETTRNDEDFACAKLDPDILDTSLNPVVECEEVNICSPNNSSNGFVPNPQAEESFMVEGINGGASEVQSWQFMEDEISNCVHNSMNSSDCISQTFIKPEKADPLLNAEKVNDGCLIDLQECNQTKLTSLEFQNDDIPFQNILSTLFKTSHQLILGQCFRNINKVSSFVSWKKGALLSSQMPRNRDPQRLLKKVLFEVARMHGGCLLESREDNGRRDGLWRPEADEIYANNVLLERRRREKIDERFLVLGSLVPSTGKADKVSVLDNTIEYLKELERRVDELESSKEVAEQDVRTKRKPHDAIERTSDNYGDNKIKNSKKPLINKRKARDIDESEPENNRVSLKDSSTDDVTVSMIDKDVLIEMRCTWRDCLLLEIMDAISDLHLDSHSVQSSNIDGILSITIRSKSKGSTVASVGMIRQALQRIVWKC